MGEVVSTKEAGRRLGGLSDDGVRALIRDGQLRAIRIGRRRLAVPVDAIVEFLESRPVVGREGDRGTEPRP